MTASVTSSANDGFALEGASIACVANAETRFRRRNTGKNEQIERQRKTELDRCIGETGSPPTDRRDQKGGKRPAHRAGEAAEQGQRRDRRARVAAIEAAQRAEGGIIETGSHAQPNNQPSGDIERKRWRDRKADLPRANSNGA